MWLSSKLHFSSESSPLFYILPPFGNVKNKGQSFAMVVIFFLAFVLVKMLGFFLVVVICVSIWSFLSFHPQPSYLLCQWFGIAVVILEICLLY